MFLNLFIVSLLAAATARTIPENGDPHFVPPPADFPRRAPLRQTPESRGTGVISQGNGDAILQEKPGFDEFKNENDNSRPNHQEQTKHFDNLGPENNGSQDNSGTILQEPYNEGFRPENDRVSDNTQDGRKKGPEQVPRGRNYDTFNLENAGEHKNHNSIQHTLKTNKNVTEKRDSQGGKVAVADFENDKENIDNKFNENQPKTNLNSTEPKTSNDNEVILEGRTMDNNLPGNGSDDRWIWADTTTTTPTDLDNRAAFDGGKCPTGQVRIKGSDMCVERDED